MSRSIEGMRETIERHESSVRSYCRAFPAVVGRSAGSVIHHDAAGRGYLDVFAGAGALNYGHDPPAIQRRLIEAGGIGHALDMATEAKAAFIDAFDRVVLATLLDDPSSGVDPPAAM